MRSPQQLAALREIGAHPLAMSSGALDSLLLQARWGFAPIGPGRDRPPQQVTSSRFPNRDGATVLIDVFGFLYQHSHALAGIEGFVSTRGVAKHFEKARDSEGCSAIVLNIDVPGGWLFGVSELADTIFEARKRKRIIAQINSQADGAGYWLAAAAGEVVMTPSGCAGGIGVAMLHVATAGYEAKQGWLTTITRMPAAKAEGAAGERLSEEALAHREGLVSKSYSRFVRDLARFRKRSEAHVQAHFGRGRTLLAEDAKTAGMVDRVATLDEILSDLP